MKNEANVPGLLAPYCWNVFAAKYKHLLLEEGLTRSIAGEITQRILLFGLLQVSWLLDEMFARSWRKVRLKGPIFIVGHPRSGTTFLHRSLVEDALEAAYGLDFGMMLLPSVLQRRITKRLLGTDTQRRKLVTSAMRRLEDRLFGGFDHIHRLRFNELEEDEYTAWSIFASVFCIANSPSTMLSSQLDYLRYPERWAPPYRRRLAAWHKACLQKAVAASGKSEGLIIGKNTALTRHIQLASEWFPESKFIYLVRNPVDAIASRLSLVEAIWKRRDPELDQLRPEHVGFLLNDSIELYRAAERSLAGLQPGSVRTVKYDELVRDPAAQIGQVLTHFGLGPPKQGFTEAISLRASQRFPGPNRTHKYALSKYGVSKDALYLRLTDVFEKYDFNETDS